MIKRILTKAGKIAAEYTQRRNAVWPAGRRVVSFSLDDFPVTAVENGASLLESHNARGTFYAALGLAGTDTPCGLVGSQQDLLAITQRGHECGCHTYSHLDLAETPARKIHDDCCLNQELAAHIANVHFRSFAYPFGNFNPHGKRVIGDLYLSARTIEAGINIDRVDLLALRAVPIYERLGPKEIECWLRKLEKDGGWLIFFTHDVSDHPSVSGCSIDCFSRVLDQCRDANVEIMTVGDAAEMCALER